MKTKPIPRHRKYGVPALTILGALTLFSSWAAEKHFIAKSAAELLYLEKTQFLIAIEEGRMTQWLIQFNLELTRSPRDSTLLASAALKTIQATTNLLGWSEARLDESTAGNATSIAAKNLYQQRAVVHYQKGEIDQLLTMVREVVESSNKTGGSLLAAFTDRLATKRREAESRNTAFLVLYSLGSSVLALAWILATFRGWPAKVEKSDA